MFYVCLALNIISCQYKSSVKIIIVRYSSFLHTAPLYTTLLKKLLGVGVVHQGLYFLKPTHSMSTCFSVDTQLLPTRNPSTSLWHNRLGHAPLSVLQHISAIKPHIHPTTQICLTCPMAKFTKLPYNLSTSHASQCFDLIHMDIWDRTRFHIKRNIDFS